MMSRAAHNRIALPFFTINGGPSSLPVASQDWSVARDISARRAASVVVYSAGLIEFRITSLWTRVQLFVTFCGWNNYRSARS